MTSQRIKTSWFLQILIVANLLLHIYDGFFGWKFRKPLFVIFSLILFCICIWEMRKEITWQDVLIGFILLYCLIYYRLVTFSGFSSFFYNLPFILVGYSLGLLYRYSMFRYSVLISYLILAFIPFLYVFVFLKVEAAGQFFSMNRNSVSILLFSAVSLQILNDSNLRKRYILIFPSVITLLLSWYSRSRTGLLITSGLFLLVVAYDLFFWINGLGKFPDLLKRSRVAMLSFFFFIGALLFLGFSYLYKDSRFFTVGLSSSGRIEIIRSFFGELNFQKLIFGFRPKDGVNLHNSFLTIISYFGVIGFCLDILIIYAFIRFYRRSWLPFGLLLLWCIYSFSERLAPFGVGVFILVPLLFLAFPPRSLKGKVMDSIYMIELWKNQRFE